MNMLKKFWKDERGVAALEYAIIAAVIAIALIVVLIALGQKILNKFTNVNDALTHSDYS